MVTTDMNCRKARSLAVLIAVVLTMLSLFAGCNKKAKNCTDGQTVWARGYNGDKEYIMEKRARYVTGEPFLPEWLHYHKLTGGELSAARRLLEGRLAAEGRVLDDYFRQYIGFTYDGEQVVHVCINVYDHYVSRYKIGPISLFLPDPHVVIYEPEGVRRFDVDLGTAKIYEEIFPSPDF